MKWHHARPRRGLALRGKSAYLFEEVPRSTNTQDCQDCATTKPAHAANYKRNCHPQRQGSGKRERRGCNTNSSIPAAGTKRALQSQRGAGNETVTTTTTAKERILRFENRSVDLRVTVGAQKGTRRHKAEFLSRRTEAPARDRSNSPRAPGPRQRAESVDYRIGACEAELRKQCGGTRGSDSDGRAAG